MSKFQSVRGIHDILPEQVVAHKQVESCAQAILQAFGYQEIRLPILEKTELFKRSIGDVTDIVEKEMYTFKDSGDTLLSLRPEGTASCVRAAIQHGLLGGLLEKGQQRLWYSGPFFRRERPQRGRYRQFYQIGAEIFGHAGAEADLELLIMMAELLQRLDVGDAYTLEINTLGDLESRRRYGLALADYFQKFSHDLSEEVRLRVERNPLRVLDSKDPALQDIIAAAPVLGDYLDKASVDHFAQLQEGLGEAKIAYRHNPRMVRGLDYYSRTVFEFLSRREAEEPQYTFCAGGRYDGLVEQLGGRAIPASGFAFGLDRFVSLYREHLQATASTPDVYVVCVGEQARREVPGLMRRIQASLYRMGTARPGQADTRRPQIVFHLGDEKLTTQLKKANKLNARLALIFAQDEMDAQQATVKFMREDKAQKRISIEDMDYFAQQLLQCLCYNTPLHKKE